MELKELSIRVPAEAEEPLTCFITESLEINQISVESGLENSFFVKVYVTEDEEIQIKEQINKFLNHLPEYGIALPFFEIQSRLIQEEDWLYSWRKYFHPIEMTKICIRPPWEEPRPGFLDLVIHPKMGFGTGQHPTTFLCLKYLENEELKNKTLADMGAGSGILGAAALLLGARDSDFFEKDAPAVESCKETVELNRLEKKSGVYQMDLLREYEGFARNKNYDMALINIIAEVIVDLLDLPAVQRIPLIYLTGIIEEKKVMVEEKIKEAGFVIEAEDLLENWVFYKIKKA